MNSVVRDLMDINGDTYFLVLEGLFLVAGLGRYTLLKSSATSIYKRPNSSRTSHT